MRTVFDSKRPGTCFLLASPFSVGGSTVTFNDGSVEDFDLIVLATGYTGKRVCESLSKSTSFAIASKSLPSHAHSVRVGPGMPHERCVPK